MRTGAAADHAGYFHETAFYRDDDELVDLVAPFLREGIAADEPVVVACGTRNTELLRRAVGTDGVLFLPGADHYARPGPTIRAYRELFRDLLSTGAPQIRVVGDVPHPGTGGDWYGWLRYEAAVNRAYDDFPLWGLCPYDLRTTPPDVVEDVRRTHPHIVDGHGDHRRNDRFTDPSRYLSSHASQHESITGRGVAVAALRDPTPAELRRSLRDLSTDLLPPSAVTDLLIAGSEIVANAHHHGQPPVTVEVWRTAHDITIAVTDRGTGPSDPLIGLLPPPPDAPDGRGLWIAHQLCTEVRTSRADGYRVVLTVTDMATSRSPGASRALTS